MASLFTKIMRGDLPSYVVWEDELTFCFLALDQIRLGHTLVVPKLEVDSFLDLPEPSYTAVFQMAQKIGRAIRASTDCKRVGLAVQGFEVPHCHIHVVPLYDATDLDFRKAKRLSPEEMQDIQTKLKAQL